MNYPKPNVFTISKNSKYIRNYPKNRVFVPQNFQKQSKFPNETSSKSNLVQQSIESSNKLDELLRKCKSIGSSSSSIQALPKPDLMLSQTIVPSNLTKINNCTIFFLNLYAI